jgi:hypothetical protein
MLTKCSYFFLQINFAPARGMVGWFSKHYTNWNCRTEQFFGRFSDLSIRQRLAALTKREGIRV